jgi:hypothetical protein
MGDTFYNLLVTSFVNDTNRHLGESVVVIAALSDILVAAACAVIAGVLVWFTRKSVLIRSTSFIYVAMAVLVCACGERLAEAFGAPAPLQMFFDLATTTGALAAACMMFRQRHGVIAMVYQFKYVVGLLRSVDVEDRS